MNPLTEIALVSAGVSIVSQTVHILMVNQDYVEHARKEIKEMSKKIRELTPGSKEYKKLFDEQMKINMKLTKQTMKPSMVTIIPFILIFSILRNRYEGMEVIQLPFTVFGKEYIGWIGTFILVSMCLSIIIQTSYKKYRKSKKAKEEGEKDLGEGDKNAETISKKNEKNI